MKNSASFLFEVKQEKFLATILLILLTIGGRDKSAATMPIVNICVSRYRPISRRSIDIHKYLQNNQTIFSNAHTRTPCVFFL